MIVYRRGYVSPFVSVDEVLRARWEDAAASISEQIEERKKNGIPLDGLEALGAYRAKKSIEGLKARFRVVSHAEVAEYELDLTAASEGADKKQADKDMREATRAWVLKAVESVSGIEDENGAEVALPLAEAVPVIEDAGALFDLATAAKAFQHLSGAEKKRLAMLGVST